MVGVFQHLKRTACPRGAFFVWLAEAVLPPGLVDGDRYGIGQVQAATARAHGQAQALFSRQAVENLGGQASAFRAEEENAPGLELNFRIAVAALGGKGH